MNATSTTTRDECILTMLDDLAGMLRNLAHKHRLEFEDCLQEAWLILAENWAYIEKANRSMTYVYVVVRDVLLRRLCETWTWSLDAPITANSHETFADNLPMPDSRIHRNEKAEKAVHAALRECTPEEQQFAHEEYGLDTFKPAPKNWRDKPVYYPFTDRYSRKDHIQASIRCALKMSPHVRKLIQRETCIL